MPNRLTYDTYHPYNTNHSCHTYHTYHTYQTYHTFQTCHTRPTIHTIHTQHTIPHTHHTTGGEGDSATHPPHHSGGRWKISHGASIWDPSHGGDGGWQGLKWLEDTNNNRIYGRVVVLKFCTIDDNWRFQNFWAICNTDDRQQQVLLRHEDKWDNLPQPRMTNQADDLTRKFGWFNVILSMKSMIQPSWLEI